MKSVIVIIFTALTLLSCGDENNTGGNSSNFQYVGFIYYDGLNFRLQSSENNASYLLQTSNAAIQQQMYSFAQQGQQGSTLVTVHSNTQAQMPNNGGFGSVAIIQVSSIQVGIGTIGQSQCGILISQSLDGFNAYYTFQPNQEFTSYNVVPANQDSQYFFSSLYVGSSRSVCGVLSQINGNNAQFSVTN